jgi:hypothetical protein
VEGNCAECDYHGSSTNKTGLEVFHTITAEKRPPAAQAPPFGPILNLLVD